MQVVGLNSLSAQLKKMKEDARLKVMADKQRAVMQLVERIMENTPVWSGRTIESIRVNNTGGLAALQGDPTRAEAATFGRTSTMPLGSEPMRGAAEAQARAQVASADYDLAKKVYVTIHSEAWGLIEQGEAPDKAGARNRAVVSEIAKQAAMIAVKSLRSR